MLQTLLERKKYEEAISDEHPVKNRDFLLDFKNRTGDVLKFPKREPPEGIGVFSRLQHIIANNRQIFHAFLFNIRNYSPEVITSGE